MKATITGNDALSKRILVDLNGRLRVSDVPKHYPISLDQAKRLSRFRKMLELAKRNLEEEYYNRFQLLGIKSLPLSHLFKKLDWTGIIEILSVVTDETTREELQLLINGLDAKRKRILEFKESADLILSQLEDTDKVLRTKEKEILQLKRDMDERFKLFKGYPEPFCSLLSEYLGLYEGELVLAKRLNSNWQRDLRKKGIIVYNEELYVYFVKDFNGFIEALKSRHQGGLEYRWNPDKNIENMDEPEEDKYNLSSSFSGPIIDSINRLAQELEDIQKKRLTIERELSSLKSKTAHSYMEIAEVSDFLSTIDLKRHKELQSKALKWLFKRGFIVVEGFTLPNGKRADILAYNESEIIIFEVKVSMGDLMTDKKWTDYLPYCHAFYFLTPSELVSSVAEKIKEVNCGQYVDAGNSLKLIQPDKRLVNEIDQQAELKFAAGQLLSRKFIYGY